MKCICDLHERLSGMRESVKSLRSWIYDTCITSMTSRWYREVLLECPMSCRMLDIGIGTGTSLIANRDIVVRKDITVMGVDIDTEYISSAAAQKSLCPGRFSDMVEVLAADIHQFNRTYIQKYDVLYFSGSFMTIPRQVEALRHCVKMLYNPPRKGPDSCSIFFTQTFERPTVIGRYVTPLIKKVLRAITTIDFGGVTYEDDFRAVLEAAGVDIVKVKPLKSSSFRTQVLIMARPKNLTPQ